MSDLVRADLPRWVGDVFLDPDIPSEAIDELVFALHDHRRALGRCTRADGSVMSLPQD
uniref:hypothetical protein n=1 Tax=Amycolatopsis sp. CA-290885 TaxID=3239925 RepID=UPI003F491E04